MTIDYYLSSISPFTYLGHTAIVDLARRHGIVLAPKPVDLGKVFENSGGLPLAKRPPARQRYRFVELQRHALNRGLPMNFKPKHFPVDATLADHTIIAVQQAGGDPLGYIGAVLAAVWADEADIADETVLADLLGKAGFDAGAVLKAARGTEVAAVRQRNTADAIAADAMGAPVYVLNGEPFWGQDRIEYLEQALVSRRAPFKPL